MAVNPIDAPAPHTPAPRASDTDTIVDLGYYLNVLVRWWKEIVFITIATALLAGLGYWLLGLRSPAVYASAADVAIIRTVSELNFDERFTTTSERLTASNASPRRNALVALALNPALAAEVIAELGDALPTELQSPSQLAERITASLASGAVRGADSDLIRIAARAKTPELAAQIATAWAGAYVRNVNAVFGQAPDEMLESMTQEQQQAQQAYDHTQSALEAFVAQSRIHELARQIEDREALLNGLRRGRTNTFNALVDSSVAAVASVADDLSAAHAATAVEPVLAEQRGKRQLLRAYLETVYESQKQVFTQQAQRDQDLLDGYYTRWLQVSRSLDEAQALRSQVAAGATTDGASASVAAASGSNALVLSLLKLQAFTQALDARPGQQMDVENTPDARLEASAADQQTAAAAPGLVQSSQPVQVQVGATPLQIQLDDKAALAPDALLAEVDALVATLTTRRQELETQITALGEQMMSGSGYTVPSALLATQSALAEAIRGEAPTLLSQNVISGTTTADLQGGLTLNAATVAGLYRLGDLQALANDLNQNEPLDATIEAMEQVLRDLRAQWEAQDSREKQLTQERDLARDALATVGNKIAELTLSRAAASSEVRFAAPGVPSARPEEGTSIVMVTAAAAILGLILGIVVAFLADFMGKRPFLARQSAPVSL